MDADNAEPRSHRARSVLLCHHDAALDRDVLARWLGSWSQLVGIVEIHEPRRAVFSRVRREFRRSGAWGLIDALAFRAYYRAAFAARDRAWERATIAASSRWPRLVPQPEVLTTRDPNSDEVAERLRSWRPDFAIARSKVLLRDAIYDRPVHGTYVLHPGICPDYRNSHGCFWAIANHDLANVGATLLRIDRGIDTGPVYAHLRASIDAKNESHVVIQRRVVLDNLDLVRARLEEIIAGRAAPLATTGRPSRAWGQPRLSAYLRGKRAL